MRIRASLTSLLTGLLVSACASTPVALPSSSDISGEWYGSMTVRGLQQPVLLHLARGTDGRYTGTADAPGEVQFGIPVKSATVEGARVKVIVATGDAEATITGALDPKTRQINGEFKQDGATASLSLRPAGPSLPSFEHPQSLFYEAGGRRIHYMQMGGASAVRIVFIHGTPGAWQGWSEYLGSQDLQRRATLIAVDRPGFGDSKGEVVPDLHEQARLLEPLLRGLQSSEMAKAPETTIVVGHSLGGPIAAELAMDYPQEVQGALLIAPSIDPATETPRWYNEAMTWWVFSKLVTTFLDPELGNANKELMPLAAQLRAMEARWKSLPMPVTVIQGVKDDLVDPRTADFAERVLPPGNNVIRVPDEGHFVLWKQPQIELQALVGLLDRSLFAGNAQVHTVR